MVQLFSDRTLYRPVTVTNVSEELDASVFSAYAVVEQGWTV